MKTALDKQDLISKANAELRQIPGIPSNCVISDARMEGGILVLLADGQPHEKPGVLERLNEFVRDFSNRHTLS